MQMLHRKVESQLTRYFNLSYGHRAKYFTFKRRATRLVQIML
jgi:hypothetical protein